MFEHCRNSATHIVIFIRRGGGKGVKDRPFIGASSRIKTKLKLKPIIKPFYRKASSNEQMKLKKKQNTANIFGENSQKLCILFNAQCHNLSLDSVMQ